MPASAQACSIVVGCNLPCQSGISFGTSISRPSTLIWSFSTSEGAGLVSIVAGVGILLNAKAHWCRDANRVAQTSQSAVSRGSKPANRTTSPAPPIWKSAIQQVGKPALRNASCARFRQADRLLSPHATSRTGQSEFRLGKDAPSASRQRGEGQGNQSASIRYSHARLPAARETRRSFLLCYVSSGRLLAQEGVAGF